MKYKNITNEDREKIVNSYINGSSATNIAKLMGYARTTVFGIIQKYTTGNDFKKKARNVAQQTFISDAQRKIMQSWINEDCTIKLKTIKTRLKEEMGIDATLPCVESYMKAFNFSFNRLNLPPQNNELTTLEARVLYANNFINNVVKYMDSKVLFINEATFSISMSTNKNLLSAKKRVDFIGKGFRKAIASMCSAMSINGLIEHQTQMMIFDIESFYKFIESVVVKLEKMNISEAIIIMDNACIGKYPRVKELIESKGHSLICLPPGSAFLNPNEAMYTKWKELIRAKDPQNGSELIKVINKVLSQIADNSCKGFYEHMLSYLPRCMEKEEILDQ